MLWKVSNKDGKMDDVKKNQCVTITLKSEDELKAMSNNELWAYWREINNCTSDVANKVRDMVDKIDIEFRREDVVKKLNKKFSGKWMYAEHGIGNNPTMAYVKNVQVHGDTAIELEIIHYAPNYSKFPIAWKKCIYRNIDDVEEIFRELDANAYICGTEKAYVEDREACKRLLEEHRDDMIDRIRNSVARAADAYDHMITAIGSDCPDDLQVAIEELVSVSPVH